jgi:hypothetical protein
MKLVEFLASLLVMLSLAGCVSSGSIHNPSPLAAKPFDLDLVLVNTPAPAKDLAAENQTLNDKLVSGLRDTQLFKGVSANKAELGAGSGITVNAEIMEIKKVSKTKRLWAGAMAGRAKIRVQVKVFNLSTGSQLEAFEAYGESSGGSDLAGTTDEAIARAAEAVVSEVVKIYSRTAE